MAPEILASRLLGVDGGPLPYLGLVSSHPNFLPLNHGPPEHRVLTGPFPPPWGQARPLTELLLTCGFLALFPALTRPPSASRSCETVGVLGLPPPPAAGG